MAADLKSVFKLINERDNQNIASCDCPSMETTVTAYTHVVKELISKPKVRAYSMSILVRDSIDFLDKTPFIDVCLLNRKYVAPREGLKPWGCRRGQKPPKGYYDCNCDKHNRTFSLMGVAWSKLIDTPVIIESTCSSDKAIAVILWELTFDGWTEKQVDRNMTVIKKKLCQAAKEIYMEKDTKEK